MTEPTITDEELAVLADIYTPWPRSTALRLIAALRVERQAAETNAAKAVELAQEVEEYDQLIGRLGELLTGVADALKGPPGPLSTHDWSDLPVVAAAVAEERDLLRERAERAESSLRRLRAAADHLLFDRRACDRSPCSCGMHRDRT